ncbi:MAG: ubiquinol-cytochrome C chaperone family protein [Caulobacteraceae bacterium]
MFQRLFPPPAHRVSGQALYASAARQARLPALYRELGAPDTVEGRFELVSLHLSLLLLRLKGQGTPAAETAQAAFDTFVQALDDAMRELGVADVSIGKKMKKAGAAFYGRMRSYETALAALPDRAELDALIGRTVFEEMDGAPAAGLADYAARAVQALATQPLAELLEGRVTWPEPCA